MTLSEGIGEKLLLSKAVYDIFIQNTNAKHYKGGVC